MNIMTKAHQIRKAAAQKWNCAASEISLSCCLSMAHKGEEMATEQQEAVRKMITDTATHFKGNVLCKTAEDEIYEQLAMIYAHHRGQGVTHDSAVEKSFARLNGNGVSNKNMIKLAISTISAQSEIVEIVKKQMGI